MQNVESKVLKQVLRAEDVLNKNRNLQSINELSTYVYVDR